MIIIEYKEIYLLWNLAYLYRRAALPALTFIGRNNRDSSSCSIVLAIETIETRGDIPFL